MSNKPQLPHPCFVDNLPAEIIAEVFANIVTSHSYNYTDQVATLLVKEALAFRRASQVSQFWRDVALHQCKDIWGSIINIDESSNAWVKELITRSGNSPLRIQSHSYRRRRHGDFGADKWIRVLAHMHRIKILHFSLQRHEDASELIYATANFPAPMLESFRVQYDRHCGEEPSPAHLSFDGRLFDDYCPNLRDFLMEKVLFTHPPMDLSTVRLVHFDITPDFFAEGPTLSEWLDMLETQPSLRYLTIKVHSTGSELDPVVSRKVCLPNLVEFSIKTAGIEGAEIFASLVLPPRCKISVVIREEDETSDDLSFIELLGETFSECIKRWSGNAQKLKVGSWGLDVGEVYFILRLGSGDDDWRNPRIQLHYYCTFESPDDTPAVFPVLSDFTDMIRRRGMVDTASRCTLGLDIPKHTGVMALLLGSCRRITHLTLMDRSLWIINDLFPEPGSRAVFFPMLKHVTLEALYTMIEESEFDHVYGCLQRFLQLISAAERVIPTTSLHLHTMEYCNARYARFAERVESSFGANLEIFTAHWGFKEFMELRYRIGSDELGAIVSA
ncbi:hypothetical protein M413DRAFT_25610 [Hebeloma cylindrosporum]|uniref:F-box domain-containing protein n=1 Tax=Hebeloma cylindrosporum TaxID=76867 RepID=A0A0C3CK74_HEBCY|nr:hypothetical protein M413DRAFT_25610 [Hebeloma cylindrosporum h7]